MVFSNIFLFSPLFGEDFQFEKYFSDGLKPPTSNFWGAFVFIKGLQNFAIKIPVPASATYATPTTQLPYMIHLTMLQIFISTMGGWNSAPVMVSWKSNELTISPYEIVIDKPAKQVLYFHLSHPSFTLNQQNPEVFQVKIAVFFGDRSGAVIFPHKICVGICWHCCPKNSSNLEELGDQEKTSWFQDFLLLAGMMFLSLKF